MGAPRNEIIVEIRNEIIDLIVDRIRNNKFNNNKFKINNTKDDEPVNDIINRNNIKFYKTNKIINEIINEINNKNDNAGIPLSRKVQARKASKASKARKASKASKSRKAKARKPESKKKTSNVKKKK